MRKGSQPVSVSGSAVSEMVHEVPLIYDVTLRDGNQALPRPWNQPQKERVFQLLCRLGVRAAEIGFPSSSKMDFESVDLLAATAPEGIVVGALSRAKLPDIEVTARALSRAKGAIPRIHTFIGMSEYHMRHVLRMSRKEVRQRAVEAVRLARRLLGNGGQVQFSPEHFGDCVDNIDWVVESLEEIVEAGADIINLPNTVERTSPARFSKMVSGIETVLAPRVTIAVHCHNDLGMSTATTVESFFAGARQLEVTLNGLGERAGNANLYEVATTLHVAGVGTSLRFELFYETALEIAKLSGVPISPKAPLMGLDVFKHRSGVHQHGVVRTDGRDKGAYRVIPPEVIGRLGDEECQFTSQSGSAAVKKIIQESGKAITDEEARRLQPALKAVSEHRGILAPEELVAVYDAYLSLRERKPNVEPEDLLALADDIIEGRQQQVWFLEHFQVMTGDGIKPAAVVTLCRNGDAHTKSCTGNGPVDAAFEAIRQITNQRPHVLKYGTHNVTEGKDAQGEVHVTLRFGHDDVDGQYADPDVVRASIHAYLSALNKHLNKSSKRG